MFEMVDNTGNRVTRGHSLKIYKKQVCTDVGKFSFSHRVVQEWNLLTEEIVQENSLDTFKGRLNHFLGHTRGLI